jgi:hypothetical protein
MRWSSFFLPSRHVVWLCSYILLWWLGLLHSLFFSTIFISLYFSKLTIEGEKERRREREKKMNDRTSKECQSSKKIYTYIEMYIRCGTFVCVYREIEFIWTDNVVSREIWSIFKQHSYIRDRRLSLRIHKGDVQPNDSTVASVIENNLSFFFFFACSYRIERERERERKKKI